MSMGYGFGFTRARRASSGGGGAVPEALSAALVAGSATEMSYLSTDIAWTNPANAFVDDATEATASIGSSLNSKLLVLTFASASIPSTARIDGITVTARVRTATGSAGAFTHQDAYLVVDGQLTGMNFHRVSDSISPTATTFTYGSSSDLWGIPLTPTALNSGTFGIALRWKRGSASTQTLNVQYVSMTVHYTTLVGANTRPMAVAMVTIPQDATAIVAKSFRVAFPGMGTPAGAFTASVNVIRTNQTTGGDTQTYDASVGTSTSMNLSYGLAKDTTMYNASNRLTTSSYASGGTIAREPNTVRIHRNQVSVTYTVLGMGDGYIDIGWSAIANTPVIIQITAFFAAESHLYTRTGWPSGGPYTEDKNIGFQPDLLIVVSGEDKADGGTHDAYLGTGVAFAKRSGSSWSQVAASTSHQIKIYDDGVPGAVWLTDNANYLNMTTDRIHYNLNPNDPGAMANGRGYEYSTRVLSASATGYLIEGFGNFNNIEDGFGILALRFTSAQIEIGIADTPTASGTIAMGFSPTGVLAVPTIMQATGLASDSTQADAFGIIAIDGQQTLTTAFVNPNAQTTMAPNGYYDRKAVRIRSSASVTALLATVTGHTSGLQLTVTTGVAAYKMPYLALA